MKDKLLHVNLCPFEEHAGTDVEQIMRQPGVVIAMGCISNIQMQVGYWDLSKDRIMTILLRDLNWLCFSILESGQLSFPKVGVVVS